MTAAIWGVGSSQFGRQPGRLPAELAWEAVLEALADAEVDGVDAAFVGTVFGSTGVAQRALSGLGLTGIPIVTVENACASGSTAFSLAHTAVVAGQYDCVLALGVEHLTSCFDGPIAPEPTDSEQAAGLLLPAIYALAASRYLSQHGIAAEELAEVAVKNSRHGALNPRAQRRRAVSVEEVLGSRMVCTPLTLYQCAGLSDAAAAVVVGSDRGGRDVPIRACALRSGVAWDHTSPNVWGFDLVQETALDAYDQACVAPAEIDVFEVHDAFTVGEIVSVEAIGLAEPGAAPAAVAEGRLSLGGEHVVNPSGGLLSRGHPLGATGLAQIAEVTWQLRGEAGARQVEGARVGLTETMGGGAATVDGNGCVVTVLGA